MTEVKDTALISFFVRSSKLFLVLVHKRSITRCFQGLVLPLIRFFQNCLLLGWILMEVAKGRRKKGLISKTWDRCRSLGRATRGSPEIPRAMTTKSKSWPRMKTEPPPPPPEDEGKEKRRMKKGHVAPEGCFSVYVGPEKKRFVIKTEYANHPLFKMLLEEAEMEYGFNSGGPLSLPCNVDLFYKVLAEMDSHETRQGCRFSKAHGSYHLLSPSRLVAMNHF